VGPVDFGREGQPQNAAELLKRIDAAENAVYFIKGDARLGLDVPQGKGTVTLFAAALHPDFVHLEQLDFFGRPQGVLTSAEGQFGLYLSSESTFYRGPASPQNLSRFLPLTIPVPELTKLLLGRVPRIPFETAEMDFDLASGVFELRLQRGGVTQVLHVMPPSYRVIDSRLLGAKSYEVHFAKLEIKDGIWFPRQLKLRAKIENISAEISWKSLELNKTADLSLFALTAPEDVKVVELDAQGRPFPEPPRSP
jgi:hypothetical protein